MDSVGEPRSNAGPETNSACDDVDAAIEEASDDRLLRVYARLAGENALIDYIVGELREMDPETVLAAFGKRTSGDED